MTVIGIVERGDEILIARTGPESDVWAFPGSLVKEGETEEQALKRAFAERGFNVNVGGFLGQKFIPDSGVLSKWYICSLINITKKAAGNSKFIKREGCIKICHPDIVSMMPEEVVEYFKK